MSLPRAVDAIFVGVLHSEWCAETLTDDVPEPAVRR